MTENAIHPDEYQPEVQAGVEYSRPKDLKAAGSDHPLYARALSKGEMTEAQVNEGRTIPWNVPATVLKNMSDGLYTSEEATFREFEANGETATRKVERAIEGNVTDNEVASIRLVPESYQPIIEVTVEAHRNRVVIRDNGKGMESATVLDVVRKIGATTVRGTGNLTGQFGMGLAAFLKLIGLDNSMIMSTHSRITDENFASYVNLGGFDPIVGGLPDDEYGTKFELIYGNDGDGNPLVGRKDMRGYVEKFSEWLRVPVHYEEYDEDGEFSFDEDWGGKRLVDQYEKSTSVVVLEVPDLLTAALCGDAEGVTLLGSMPTDRNDGGSHNSTKQFGAPYEFDVRIEDESGAIIFAPDRNLSAAQLPDGFDYKDQLIGCTPVSDAEYNIMDAQQKQDHIRESEVPTGFITLPVPTSSRDSLQEHEEFWKELASRLEDAYITKAKETYNSFSGVEELLKIARESPHQ